jgi:hypothetical protein
VLLLLRLLRVGAQACMAAQHALARQQWGAPVCCSSRLQQLQVGV